MFYTSLYFPFLLPVVAFLVAVLPSARVRNACLLAGSYAMYLAYMPWGAAVLLALTAASYFFAILCEDRPERRRTWAALAVVTVLGALVVFKYLDFLLGGLADALGVFGCGVSFPSLKFILPIGISYFAFQMTGYAVDVFKGKIRAERNFTDYALLTAYYVKLTAGPIVDSGDFLGQLKVKKPFSPDLFYLGVRQILWGWFLKLCVAERVAPYVNAVFGNVPMHTGTTCALAAFFYMFQIYADFAGYTLLAVGTSNCLGLTLPPNFDKPYLALNPKEFWRSWHISLTSWLTKYLYIPLGGSRRGRLRQLANVMTVFVASGLWHGANWTFVFWGALHGVALCAHVLWSAAVPEKFRQSALWKPFALAATFLLVGFAWIFFRADTIADAFTVIGKILTDRGNLFIGDGKPNQLLGVLFIAITVACEIRERYFGRLKFLYSSNLLVSGATMAAVVIAILTCGILDAGGNFIYYKF